MPKVMERLVGAVSRALGPGVGTTAQSSRAQIGKLEDLGIRAVGYSSKDEDLEQWEKKLWTDQDWLIEERSKEWRQNLHYVAAYQFIAYHKTQRRWIPRKSVPWRIRSAYNLLQKAVNIRVARLTENKPTVTVVAGEISREDVERAEYKESLWWYLWNTLALHLRLILGRRWASKTGFACLKTGWDPDAGPETPATKKRVVFVSEEDPNVEVPPEQGGLVEGGAREFYVDEDDKELGPVEEHVKDEETDEWTRRRRPAPDGTQMLREGEVFCTIRSPFNIRFDRYVDDIEESWYVQDAEILPATKVVAMFPDKLKEIQEAQAATEDDKAIQWTGLTPLPFTPELGGPSYSSDDRRSQSTENVLDREFLVRETWIWPQNEVLRKLWGEKGALLVTVGGKLVRKTSLPEWALKKKCFVQLVDIPEEGNHYYKSFLRDLLPIQDDINRSRSHMAEDVAVRSRVLIAAPRGARLNFRLAARFPAVYMTYREGRKPETMRLSETSSGAELFYDASIAAATDLGNMNEASTGKLPSAGLAAKAIYALQFADERSVQEISNLQDIALQRLAMSLDAITRHEYTETRKIRIVGEDRAFMTEHELHPEHLQADVDYYFVPGSMLSRQKEAVKNELIELKDQGLISPEEVRKNLSTTVPEVFRESYDLQVSAIRRKLERILSSRGQEQIQPEPWERVEVATGVLEEFMLTRKWEVLGEHEQAAITQLWQAYQVQAQQAAAAAAAPAGAPGAAEAGGGGALGAEGLPETEFATPEGAGALEAMVEEQIGGPAKAFEQGQPA